MRKRFSKYTKFKYLQSWQYRRSLQNYQIVNGYENQKLVESIVQKNLIYRKNLQNKELDFQAYRTIAAIGAVLDGKTNFSVLDLGGGGGHHSAIAEITYPETKFNWVVLETEALASEANKRVSSESLRFISSFSEIKSDECYDLLYSNSALQYTPNPLEYLANLLDLNCDSLFITRVPLAINRTSFSYLQESMMSHNGPGESDSRLPDSKVTYINRIVNRAEFERVIKSKFEIEFTFREGISDVARFGDEVQTFGYLCRRYR
jgi:putative methyltransferase (TIGR04325 family)